MSETTRHVSDTLRYCTATSCQAKQMHACISVCLAFPPFLTKASPHHPPPSPQAHGDPLLHKTLLRYTYSLASRCSSSASMVDKSSKDSSKSESVSMGNRIGLTGAICGALILQMSILSSMHYLRRQSIVSILVVLPR